MNIIIKTKELIFHRPHTTKFDVPCTCDGIAQEHVAKLLGVLFSDTLRFEAHVNFLSTDEIVETPRLFLPPTQLQTVFTALILSRITCYLSLG